MHRIDILIALVAVSALAVVAWSNPLEKLPFWIFVLLCALFHPAGTGLFSALESAVGPVGRMGQWTFMLSVSILFAALVASAHGKIRSVRDARARRHAGHQEAGA